MLTGGDNSKRSLLYVKYQHLLSPLMLHTAFSRYHPHRLVPPLVDGTGVADDLPFLPPRMGGCWETLGS